IGCPRDHAPGLGDRVDPALVARERAEWRTVIEITTPVPVAIPHVPLKRSLQRHRVRAPYRGARLLLASFRQGRKGRQCRVQEPAEPDALALAQLTDPVQAVVPVTRADQG